MDPVRPVQNEALRYYVQSDSNPDEMYIVDLAAYGGSGSCTCADFSCRRVPKLNDGQRLVEAVFCKHIKAARKHFTDMALKHAAAALAGKRSLAKSSRLQPIRQQLSPAPRQQSTSDTRVPF